MNIAGNPRRVCLYHALQMALFPMAIITVHLSRNLDMGLADVMFAQACFGAALALFEFPSGYLADRIGYRRTLVIAAALSIVGWGFFTAADTFAAVVGAQILLGVAMSLISGTDSALLYESLVATDREGDFARWTGLMRAAGQTAEGTAALVAGPLFAWWARAPFALELALWALAGLVALRMVEPPRHAPVVTDHVAHVRAMWRLVVRERPRLRAAFLLSIALGLSTYVPVWIVSVHASEGGLPDAWLGVLWAVANYSVAAAALLSDRFGRALGLLPALGMCLGLLALGYLGMGLTHALFGFAFYYCFTVVRGLCGPILHHAEQRLVPSGDRAGFISLHGLLFQLGFLAVGPVVGLVIDARGTHTGLLAAGGILVSAGAAVWLAARRAGLGTSAVAQAVQSVKQ